MDSLDNTFTNVEYVNGKINMYLRKKIEYIDLSNENELETIDLTDELETIDLTLD